MKKTVLACMATAALTCAGTLMAVRFAPDTQPGSQLKLENARVRVSELVSPPGVARARHTRPTDQVIVFLDDCRYERTDPADGSKSIRERKSGEVIWHSKGEEAPVLINAGKTPYRTILIELK
jgi:hypothetical protein